MILKEGKALYGKKLRNLLKTRVRKCLQYTEGLEIDVPFKLRLSVRLVFFSLTYTYFHEIWYRRALVQGRTLLKMTWIERVFPLPCNCEMV